MDKAELKLKAALALACAALAVPQVCLAQGQTLAQGQGLGQGKGLGQGQGLGQGLAAADVKLLPADHPSIKAVAGGWEIEARNGRKCRVQLNPKGTRADLVIGVPAPCKMSLPALGPVSFWALGEDGRLVFKAADGKTLTQFMRTGTGPMTGRLGADEMKLTPSSGRYPDAARVAAVVAATSPQKATIARVARAAPPPTLEQVPGLYALMRQPGREACRIMLDMKATAKPGQSTARFAGKCGDTGLAIFDPVAWRFADGRLILVAKKGHEAGFTFEQDNMWRRDPPSGAALLMGKVVP